MRAFRSIHGEPRLGGGAEAHGSMKKDPANVTRWKHKFGFHNRCRSGLRREGLDTAHGTRTAPQGGCDDQLAQGDEATNGEETTEGERRSKEETKRCAPRSTREARGGQETDAGNHG